MKNETQVALCSMERWPWLLLLQSKQLLLLLLLQQQEAAAVIAAAVDSLWPIYPLNQMGNRLKTTKDTATTTAVN